MRSYPVKTNHIGSAVSEILWYKHTHKKTDKQIDILLLYYKDFFYLFNLTGCFTIVRVFTKKQILKAKSEGGYIGGLLV